MNIRAKTNLNLASWKQITAVGSVHHLIYRMTHHIDRLAAWPLKITNQLPPRVTQKTIRLKLQVRSSVSVKELRSKRNARKMLKPRLRRKLENEQGGLKLNWLQTCFRCPSQLWLSRSSQVDGDMEFLHAMEELQQDMPVLQVILWLRKLHLLWASSCLAVWV